MKKNNTWNIRRLFDESFVPANQRTSVLYCRLSDLKWSLKFHVWKYVIGYNIIAVCNTIAVSMMSPSQRLYLDCVCRRKEERTLMLSTRASQWPFNYYVKVFGGFFEPPLYLPTFLTTDTKKGKIAIFLKTYPPQRSNVIVKWSLTDTAILQKIWQKIVYDFSPPFKSVFNLGTRIV